MIDPVQMQLLVYNHAVQLTLLDYEVEAAFAVAHRTAALGFDDDFMRAGLAAAARTAMGDANQVLNSPQRPAAKPVPTR